MNEKYNLKEKSTVYDYLKLICEISNQFIERDEKSIIVFRGEPQVYPTFGMPGLFRENYLSQDPYFEKNLLHEIKANGLSRGNNNLEIAIDAQHGGFPSRLLDISYNCLIALYFACVSKPERKDEEGKQPGQVIIYSLKQSYCPTSDNVIKNYDEILTNPDSYINEAVFQSNYKLIDHIRINPRISAQQGGFILFQGKEWKKMPERFYKRIEIDAGAKKMLAEQLERFFGINTSYVYPEIDYSIEKIKERTTFVNAEEMSLKNELLSSFKNEKEEIKWQLNRISENNNVLNEKVDMIDKLEKNLRAYKEDFNKLLNRTEFDESLMKNEEEAEKLKLFQSQIKNEYNDLIAYYDESFKYYIKEKEIENCSEQLKWEN